MKIKVTVEAVLDIPEDTKINLSRFNCKGISLSWGPDSETLYPVMGLEGDKGTRLMISDGDLYSYCMNLDYYTENCDIKKL